MSKLISISVIAVLCIYLVRAQISESETTCPGVFRSSGDQEGMWLGELTLRTDFTLTGLWVRVDFDKKVHLVGSTFDAVIKTEDNQSYLFRNPSFILHPDTIVTLRFFVKYSELEATPQVVSVKLNGRPLCSQPAQAPRISPCPTVFLYDEREEVDRWYGTLTLRTDVELQGVWIAVEFDNKAELVGSQFPSVKSTDNQAFVISDKNYTLKPGTTLEVPFFVKYSALDPIPAVKVIRLNARTLCGSLIEDTNTVNSPTAVQPTGLSKSSIDIPSQPVIPETRPQEPTNPQSVEILPFTCGTREIDERIFFGTPTTIEQYPWHGAIYLSHEYACGLSLISPNHALSAAHCFYNSFKQPVDIRTINLYFGISNLRMLRAPEVQNVKVAELFKHPEYKYHIPKFDIAVVRFDRPVTFSRFIQPICLWNDGVDLRTIENTSGVVAGFGLTEVGTRSEQLLWARILVVDSETCREINPAFYVHLSKNSYCAGNLTRSSVCRGDSGGGMYFLKPGTDIWQIRGITSTSKPNGATCDNSYYAIFTDVARYKDWVEQQMKKSTDIQPMPLAKSSITTTSEPELVTTEKNVEMQSKPQTIALTPVRCGMRKLDERIFFGFPSTIEQYPWHGAIFISYEYACGMSLISPYHAITAAHCFYNSFKQPVDLKTVNLYFGLLNLRKTRSMEVQNVKVAELFTHPEYEYHSPKSDIAVIKFDRSVTFNERIQPVCLWDDDVDLQTVENKTGIVTGFGITDFGRRSEQLLWTKILVVDSETCREVNPEFYILLSKYSFCAGNLTRSSVCRGDSGGGMFFLKPGTDIWQIRGITSTSRPHGSTCDYNYYAIFTDVARYKDWIIDQLRK